MAFSVMAFLYAELVRRSSYGLLNTALASVLRLLTAVRLFSSTMRIWALKTIRGVRRLEGEAQAATGLVERKFL